MTFTRRSLIQTGAATGAGALISTVGTVGLAGPALADSRAPRHEDHDEHASRELFGPLTSKDSDLLALPAGFSYRLVAVGGETTLETGEKTPGRPDGTLVVATRSGYRLIQNHELSPGETNAVPHVKGTVYDAGVVGGGCTIIDTDKSGKRIREFVGLSGTVSNCAGGPTPWNTWLTCEESETKAGGVYQQDHGYVFEVFPDTADKQVPLPIKAFGRAPHEAVVIEPSLRRAYLTEDSSKPTGLLYRWTAPGGSKLGPGIAKRFGANDGTLEALVVHTNDGSILPDLSYVTSAEIGRPFTTSWKSVPDRSAATTSLRKQFADGEVTRSKKLEGAWGDEKGMYFVASFAFAADIPANATPHDGQLWFYDYKAQTLTLQAYFPYNALLHNETPDWEKTLGQSLDLAFDGPDGCHVSPYGSLVLTEDGNTANHVLSWSRSTGAQAIARNLIVLEKSAQGGNVYSEMTGPCFTPDGRTLFVNVQEPGHTFAITGPWKKYLG